MGTRDADTTAGGAGTTALLDRGVGDADAVRAALRELEPLDREVVVLRYRHLLGLDSIASLTGSTRGAVIQRLRRVALAVERAVGSSVALVATGGTVASPLDEDEAVEDARIGVTPQLAARLHRAVTTGEVPVVDRVATDRRRLAARAWLHRHAGQLLTVVVTGSGALLTTAVVVAAV